MEDLFMILFLLSFVGLIIGMIKPKIVIKWGKKKNRLQVLKYYGIGIIIFFVLFGMTSEPVNKQENGTIQKESVQKKVENNDSSVNQEIEDKSIKIKIISSGKWRGVYGNDKGVVTLKGDGDNIKTIPEKGSVSVCIQKLDNKDNLLQVKLLKNEKVVEEGTTSNIYDTISLLYGQENKDLSIKQGKLNPVGDVDNDGEYALINCLDPLPNQYGTVTENEYEKLVKHWTKEIIPVIDKATNIVMNYKNNEITKSQYFESLGRLSSCYTNEDKINKDTEIKHGPMNKVYGAGGLNDIISPKKFDKKGYYLNAISLLDIIFVTYSNWDGGINASYFVKKDLQDVSENLNSFLIIANIKEVNKLNNKIINLKEIIPREP